MEKNRQMTQEAREVLFYLARFGYHQGQAATERMMDLQAIQRLSFTREIYSTLGFKNREKEASSILKDIKKRIKRKLFNTFSCPEKQARSLISIVKCGAEAPSFGFDPDIKYSVNCLDLLEYLASFYSTGGVILTQREDFDSYYLARESYEIAYQIYGFLGDFIRTQTIRDKIIDLKLGKSEDTYHQEHALHYAKSLLRMLSLGDICAQQIPSYNDKGNLF
jgi:hypothetical protein